ncbi:MAG: hypothetical protein WC058_06670, partial [Phycisphaeraceae bacterium]
ILFGTVFAPWTYVILSVLMNRLFREIRIKTPAARCVPNRIVPVPLSCLVISAWNSLVQQLACVFTAPTAEVWRQLALGWVLHRGPATVTGMIRVVPGHARGVAWRFVASSNPTARKLMQLDVAATNSQVLARRRIRPLRRRIIG